MQTFGGLGLEEKSKKRRGIVFDVSRGGAEARRLIGGGVDSNMSCEEYAASERFGCLGFEEKSGSVQKVLQKERGHG